MSHSEPSTRLVVFADDWGRHPSSCQHLVGRLLSLHPTIWVNTIGMRRLRCTVEDAGKALARIRQWAGAPASPRPLPHNLVVLTPWMWPRFRRRWQRRCNALQIGHCVNRALGPRCSGERRVAVTTLPIAADLVGRIDVDRWVYYCVDDFSVWPGLDGDVMQSMERLLVERVDGLITVSRTLQDRFARSGTPHLLTHGIDVDHWHSGGAAFDRRSMAGLPSWFRSLQTPIYLFWGLVDRRLDTQWCCRVASGEGTLVLAGPHQSPDPALKPSNQLVMPGPIPYEQLPELAAACDVLVMPYADMPVTRAMQPLKLTEYLATGKPVVVRRLPATVEWVDAADVVDSADDFVRAVQQRAHSGVPDSQRRARRRLGEHAWQEKAHRFERLLLHKAA